MFMTVLRQAGTGLRVLLVATVLLGIGYPLAVWGVSRVPGLHDHAEGSPLVVDGRVVGSELIGVDPVPANPAQDPFFHTRPSASADGNLGPGDPATSGGSNLSADNAELLAAVQERRAAIAVREAVVPAAVPADAVTASASGVDPGISPAYAELQAPRVARVTGLPLPEVHRLIAEATSGGVVAERTVAVPALNAAIAGAPAHTG
ncbi:potassium-transporting ATPase subunit C [Saccharopolyspora sp. NFXS83]|uniref:potassium-transporting ATPase subunit C n=1 Tax=Saccharopolyspora sp. NFXS83 TaxID=2993560 RepID=UPI00224AED56|nr:potassium-transporting ATPase subunit C [Saccharopolyspora sp. NFXS83]MCX2733639.1 potassium-transporting ATPase subunit C [Saccharopolyspora sp. NFXS83]